MEEHAPAEDIKALVVDDEESLADLVAMALRYEGWQVKTAHNVADAVAAHKEFSPDIAVLDIMLPDGSGLTLCRKLRKIIDTNIIFLI